MTASFGVRDEMFELDNKSSSITPNVTYYSLYKL